MCCVLSDMSFVCLRAAETTQRGPLMGGSGTVQLRTRSRGACGAGCLWELSGTGAKALCQMFGRGKELSWTVSRANAKSIAGPGCQRVWAETVHSVPSLGI